MGEVTQAVADSDRAAVIFDVDGVLRVFADRRPGNYSVQEEYPLFAYNPGLSKPLNNLLDLADGYYISDWRENSHEHIGKVFGLPELNWINSDGYALLPDGPSHRALAITALFGERPVAWIDDEITEADHQWAQERETPTLTLATDEEIGLTIKQVVLVESWLKLL